MGTTPGLLPLLLILGDATKLPIGLGVWAMTASSHCGISAWACSTDPKRYVGVLFFGGLVANLDLGCDEDKGKYLDTIHITPATADRKHQRSQSHTIRLESNGGPKHPS